MNILDLIEADGVKLTRQGKPFRGRCPFHEGKTETSLLVDADAGKYHCFGCDHHGDAIQWLRERGAFPLVKPVKSWGMIRGHKKTGHVRRRRHGRRKRHPLRRRHGRKRRDPFLTGRLIAYGQSAALV